VAQKVHNVLRQYLTPHSHKQTNQSFIHLPYNNNQGKTFQGLASATCTPDMEVALLSYFWYKSHNLSIFSLPFFPKQIIFGGLYDVPSGTGTLDEAVFSQDVICWNDAAWQSFGVS